MVEKSSKSLVGTQHVGVPTLNAWPLLVTLTHSMAIKHFSYLCAVAGL